MPEGCTCMICGPCIMAAQAAQNNYAQTEATVEFSPTETAPFRSLALPGGVIVYVLGSIDNKPNQISIFSGINGWHIRDIPAARFINPVMVGAGAGKLAVVEHFPDYDMIRITDEYGGGGRNSYDVNGFPLKSVNFADLKDFRQIYAPRGTRVTGLKILSNGMLIAGLSSGNDTFTYLKALTDTLPTKPSGGDPTVVGGPFETTTPYEGIATLPAPFDTVGNPTGSLALFDANGGDRMYQVFAAAQNSTLGASIVLFDFIRNKVVGHCGLPSTGKVISMHQSGEIINVLFNTGSATEIIRLQVNQSTYFMAGQRSDKAVPQASEFTVYHTFSPQDDPSFSNVSNPTLTDLLGYLQFAGLLNKNSNYFGPNTTVEAPNVFTTAGVLLGSITNMILLLLSGGSIDASDPANPIIKPTQLSTAPDGPFTPITPTSDSVTEMDGRTPTSETYKTLWGPSGTKGTSYPAQLLPGSSYNTLYLEGTEDTIAELYAKNDPATGQIDITKAIFLLTHGSHYDWLSRGGFTYGCTTGGTTIAQTNGIVGISIATDLSGELGQHKDLPDLKAVLYDTVTGLPIYRQPKPQGYTIYGGNYATLKFASTKVKKSQCGINVDAEASLYDGIDRDDPTPTSPALGTGYPVMASSEVPVAAWNNPKTDLDYPWQFFNRRTQGVTDTEPSSTGGTQYVSKVTPTLAGWTYHNPYGSDILPWWRTGAGELQSPVVVTKNGNGTLFYPVNGGVYAADNDPNGIHKPVFTANALGGFFNLGLKMTPTVADSSVYEIIPAAQNLQAPINPSPTNQAIDPVTGGTDEVPAAITPGTAAWQSISIPGDDPDIKRGVVIDPGIRSWLAVEIKLNRNNRPTGDGQNVWAQPEDAKGLLGLNVGPAATADVVHAPAGSILYPFCGGIVPGFVYDAGDSASGGATGAWEVEIYANSTPIAKAGTQVTFPEQITQLAPADMQDSLQQVFNLLNNGGGVDPDVGLHFGKVYFSEVDVNTITIKVRLVNYAYDVYRFGTKTIQHVITKDEKTGGPAQPGDYNAIITGYRAPAVESFIANNQLINQFTFGADPGWYWGNNCEAFCFGNVTCGSVVFQGSKLCTTDPVDAVVRNVLWEGQAVYAIPSTNNPYATEGLAIGKYINAYFEFQLNGGLFNYNINLRAGDGRTQGPGACGT